MLVRVLGPLAVEENGRSVAVGGSRLRALLARLALARGAPVTTGQLVDALWEEDLPADHVHALQSLVSRLRRALGRSSVVAPAPGGYRLHAEVDVGRFERLVEEGRPGEALALWRGPALADLTGYRFAADAAAQLEDLRLRALADRVDADLASGAAERVVPELERLVAEHPLHERLAAQLIAALSAAGRQAEALTAYERVRERLAEELGVPPGPELQSAHMAVLQAGRRRTNLTAPVTSFVGREHEIARIGNLLERERLITLLGPGGAGKTRLAREAMSRWVDRVKDGVWMVELAPVETDVTGAVLGALGLRDAVLREAIVARHALDRLLDALAERETILILDNCEHVVAGAAELAEQLLGGCPRLRIVATSREALGIAGESIVPVTPLEQTAAERLFGDRARAARPDFAFDEHAAEICRRLDGLPLALELAAARLRTLSASELAARLDDRFRLLTGGSRTALPRHRTLRAVVDWSWELLEEPERRLTAQLAVFPAGATVESASAVAGEDVLDGLSALAERSLIQVVAGEPTRYRMLETIREYALEKLAGAGELEQARDRHARYFAALVARAEPELRGADQHRWFARLQDERENILAALRHLGEVGDARGALRLAVDLLWFWLLSGSEEETRRWLAFALAVPGESDPADRAIAEAAQRMAAIGEQSEIAAVAAELADVADALDDEGRPLISLARAVLPALAGDEARGDAAQAQLLAHRDPWVRAAARLFAAGRAENGGEQEAVAVELAAARAGFDELGDSWGLAMTLFLESSRLLITGDLERAEAAATAAAQSLARFSSESGMLALHLADIRIRRGDLAGARELTRRAQEQPALGGDDTAFLQALQARIAYLDGDLEEAARVVAEARERLARGGPTAPRQGHGRAMLAAIGATVAARSGDFAEAERRLAEAHAVALATEDKPMVASIAVAAATVADARGDREAAAELVGAAAALRGADDPTNPDVVRLGLADVPRMSRDAALACLQAEVSRAAPVGP